MTGSYPVEYTQGDLDVIDFDEATMTFTNRRMIAPGGGQAIAFPSFTPDSAWVVYQQGDYSRAKYGTSSVGHDDLFMTDLAMAKGPLSLANASGATLSTQNQHLAYQPTVNPIAVGGYVWVVFVSPRDYGNEMLSVSNPTYENRKQLWVAAVDVNPTARQGPEPPRLLAPRAGPHHHQHERLLGARGVPAHRRLLRSGVRVLQRLLPGQRRWLCLRAGADGVLADRGQVHERRGLLQLHGGELHRRVLLAGSGQLTGDGGVRSRGRILTP